MVYQCLQCGQAFPGGSNELLKGCPGCGGTRFFFTQKPLDESARRTKEAESKADVKNVLRGLLADEQPEAGGRSWQEWLRVDPEAVKEAVEEIRQRAGDPQAQLPGAPNPDHEPAIPKMPATEAEARAALKALRQATLDEHPETPTPESTNAPSADPQPANAPVGTVNVKAPGEYEIDVERLMDANPVVVEKDGVYMIHLASVFDTNAETRKRATPKTA